MLFLGIDQHARQLAVSLRDQNGDVILARQVSTQPKKILDFFGQLTWGSARFQMKDRIEVKSYVGGLVESFKRKAA